MAIEYVIRIEDGTRQHGSSTVAGASEAAAAPVASEKQDTAKKIGSVGEFITSKAIAPMVKSITTHKAATVSIESGSQELQERTNAIMASASALTSAVSNMSSAMAVLGPSGAIIGLIVTAINFATQIGIKQAQINQQAKLEGEQLTLYRSRLGAAYNGGRSGGMV